MTSLVEAAQTFPSRNPRRRPRVELEEGGSLRQPQRKKSKIVPQSIISSAITNGDQVDTDPTIDVRRSAAGSDNTAPHSLDIPIRGRHRGGRHVRKDDGCTTLTLNSIYQVKQMPGLPKQLQAENEGLRVVTDPVSGYAIAVTYSHVYVWNYQSNAKSPEAHTFDLPNPSSSKDPLPFALFVNNTSSGDVGLLVISANTGSISYWETIEHADALSLFTKRRNGFQASCGKMMFGESVISVENIDPAGFLISVSSGRVAQLLLRDTHSKVSISVNFLRQQKANSGFSILKSYFSGTGVMNNIIGSRSRPSSVRGEMEIILANSDGLFQFWRLGWSGQALFVGETSALSTMGTIFGNTIDAGQSSENTSLAVLDFAILSRSSTDVSVAYNRETGAVCDLLALVSVSSDGPQRLALVELHVQDSNVTVTRTIHLNLDLNGSAEETRKPRLILPKHSNIAFVITRNAVVMASLATVVLTNDAQLKKEMADLPEPFQDTIYLRDGDDHRLLDFASENYIDRRKHSSIMLFVKASGLLRVTAINPMDTRSINETDSRLSAKEQIEQAVFYGTISNNPLNLSRRPSTPFSIEETEQAAVEISDEVLETQSRFIEPDSPSMEDHLEQRGRVMEQLASYLKSSHPNISRATKWRLLWNAEKIAAASKIWLLYDQSSVEYEVKKLFRKLLKLHFEKQQIQPETDVVNDIVVREWFFSGLKHLGLVLALVYSAIAKITTEDGITDKNDLVGLVIDGNEMLVRAFETVFEFRMEKLETFALASEDTERGVLRQGYETISEFWTSTHSGIKNMQSMFKNAGKLVKDFLPRTGEPGIPPEEILVKLAGYTPRVLELFCKMSEERSRWYLAQKSDAAKQEGEQLWVAYESARLQAITKLADMGLSEPGIVIAEQHRDVQALVYLVMEETEFAFSKPSNPEEAQVKAEAILILEKRIKNYFRIFGDEWANALYSAYLQDDCYALLLEQGISYKTEVTRFLRAESDRAKLSWLNDVLSEKSFSSAGKALLQVAENNEQDLWSRKVELSLAKLALAAASEEGSSGEMGSEEKAQVDSMALVGIQDKVYDHMRPVLYNAMDEAAELQLAMENFGRLSTEGRYSLQQLLERDMEQLLKHSVLSVEQLIDVLTLIDQRHCELKKDDIAGKEFVLALNVVAHSHRELGPEKTSKLLTIIWRRCFLRDDWKYLAQIAGQSDVQTKAAFASTTLVQTYYEGYSSSMWSDESVITIPKPSSLLGQCISVKDISDRFPEADINEPIARDLQDEDAALRYNVEHWQLDQWAKSAQQAAQGRATEDARKAAAKRKKMEELEQEILEEEQKEDEEEARPVGEGDSGDDDDASDRSGETDELANGSA